MLRSRFFSKLILVALALGAAAEEPWKPPADFPGLKYRLLGPTARATRSRGRSTEMVAGCDSRLREEAPGNAYGTILNFPRPSGR